jgi:hypothetical protein
MRRFLITVLVAALTVGSIAHAQKNVANVRYKWRDAQGLPHYSDSLTAEAMKYGYDLVDDRGLVIQHVARQLNPEERAAANKLAEAQAAKDRAAKEQADADAQMMSGYPDEQTYQISLQQQLDTVDQQIRTTQINLHSQEKALTDLLGRAADLEREKQPVPKNITDSIAKQRDVVATQRNTLMRQQDGRAQAVQQQAAALAHYRELKAAELKREQGEDAH